jgi:hypothetical protein
VPSLHCRGITLLPPPRRRLHADQTHRPADIAVDMMDNANALPTCPQRQQQKKTAVRKWFKITHTTSRRGLKRLARQNQISVRPEGNRAPATADEMIE